MTTSYQKSNANQIRHITRRPVSTLLGVDARDPEKDWKACHLPRVSKAALITTGRVSFPPIATLNSSLAAADARQRSRSNNTNSSAFNATIALLLARAPSTALVPGKTGPFTFLMAANISASWGARLSEGANPATTIAEWKKVVLYAQHTL
ncbi:hypothetical protein M0804_015328 [Polistes exclamans]|nr:hypothetical protein M0804_015328 [Polistes exclamans]